MTSPRLPAVGVSALLGGGAGLRHDPHWSSLVESLTGFGRKELLQRVAPPGDWHGMDRHDVRLLGLLLDGNRWSRDELRTRLQQPDRRVRDHIEHLRHLGFPVVSRSTRKESGYRLTSDPEEIEEYLEREVTPRAMRQHEIEQAMRRAAQRCRAYVQEGAVQPAQLRLEEVA